MAGCSWDDAGVQNCILLLLGSVRNENSACRATLAFVAPPVLPARPNVSTGKTGCSSVSRSHPVHKSPIDCGGCISAMAWRSGLARRLRAAGEQSTNMMRRIPTTGRIRYRRIQSHKAATNADKVAGFMSRSERLIQLMLPTEPIRAPCTYDADVLKSHR